MTAAEALGEVRRLAAKGYVLISEHAELRMRQRGALRADVLHALVGATRARWQPEHERWRIDGVDRDGDELACAVEIEADVIVVTIF